MFVVLGILFTGSGWARTRAPELAEDPHYNQAVRLEIGDHEGDESWMYLPLPETITPGDHSNIWIYFEIYRETGDGWAENLYWSWNGDIDPGIGTQWDHWGTEPPWTYPFNWWSPPPYQHTLTLFDQYAAIEMLWDIDSSTVSSWYGYSAIDVSQPLTEVGTYLDGYRIYLRHDAATGSGSEVVWINYFMIIVDDEVYYESNFEGLAPGPLNGQDDWQAGANITVNLVDFAEFAGAWLTSEGQAGYDDQWDFVDDNSIDLADLRIFCSYWLQ